MGLLDTKPTPLGSEDLEEMEVDDLLKGARRYEAELQRRRAEFDDPGKTGRINSLDEYHRLDEFLDS